MTQNPYVPWNSAFIAVLHFKVTLRSSTWNKSSISSATKSIYTILKSAKLILNFEVSSLNYQILDSS